MTQAIPVGYCQCGCGEKTSLAKSTNATLGNVAGEPVRFLLGHSQNGRLKEKSNAWKGGKYVSHSGYVQILAHDHPKASRGSRGYVLEHIIVAEKALGKRLPVGAVIHHLNQTRSDNANGNLVICPSVAYHMLLNTRYRAYIACGKPSWKKCPFCKCYDAPDKMIKYSTGTLCHRECKRIAQKRRRLIQKRKENYA